MAGVTEEYIKKIVDEVAIKNNMLEWQMHTEKFESSAQNYFGVLIPIVLTGIKDDSELSLNLVLKLAPTDERYRVSGALSLFFEREMFFYSSMLAKYHELQQNFKVKLIVPKCYYCRAGYCSEVIVLQNMCADQYKPFTLETFLNFNHMNVSLKELAKFHALSFILKTKDEPMYRDAEKKCAPLNENNNKRFMEILKDRLGKAIQIFENTKYVPLLQHLRVKCSELVEATSLEVRVRATALCHGDIWKENILYCYDENNVPVSACLIDFQTVRMGAPAYDVLYLITSSSNQQMRYSHFDELLNVYYCTFERFLQQAGIEAGSVYSRGDFNEDLLAVGPACLIIANTAMWLHHGLQEEGHVRSKKILSNDNEKAEAIRNYKDTIKNIIDDFTGYGYLTTVVDEETNV